MRNTILIIIFFCAVQIIHAQEKMMVDSVKIQLEPAKSQPVNEPFQRFDDILMPDIFTKPDLSIFSQPLLPDYTKNLDFSKYLFNKENHLTFQQAGFSPQFPWGQVFNQSTIELSDKVMIGGNSFGARSVFDNPKLNPSVNDFSIKGASMFLQYKVSEKFKVQTRVSITNRPSTPGMVW